MGVDITLVYVVIGKYRYSHDVHRLTVCCKATGIGLNLDLC